MTMDVFVVVSERIASFQARTDAAEEADAAEAGRSLAAAMLALRWRPAV